jgi:hypothetical protein
MTASTPHENSAMPSEEIGRHGKEKSTVRFRNGAPLKDQVRSSLNSSYPTLRMGAVAVLGGIWEIVFCRPAELAPALSDGAMLRPPVPSGS